VQNLIHENKIDSEVAKQSLIGHHPQKYECHLVLLKVFLGMLVATVIDWPNKTII
jgi:hypothetical protein